MKKLILILIAFITFQFTNAQNPPDVLPDGVQTPSINFKTKYTIAERDALTVGANDRKLIYVVDTGVNENQIWNGTAWVTLGGGGTTPTIQEVLTQGDSINANQKINFKDLNGIANSSIEYVDFSFIDPMARALSIKHVDTLGFSQIQFLPLGLLSNYTTNTDSLTETNIYLKKDRIEIGHAAGQTNGKGLVGTFDYSANILSDSLAYPQLGLVKTLIAEASSGGLNYGTRLTASITGATNLDWSTDNTVFDYTLTGATTLANLNLPTGTQTKVIELIVRGDFALTLPATWTALPNNDAYDGTVDNHIVVTCINGTTSSEIILYSLTNI
jgi:hypothetical protein